MSFTRRCIVAVGVFAALSCSSERPTQPAAARPPEFQLTTLSGGPIPIPGNNTDNAGTVDWTPVAATVANKFILIKVTGTVAISTNQQCSDTFTLPCQYPLSGEVVGPLGDLYGWLKVSIREVPGSVPGLSGPTGGTYVQGVIFGSGGQVQAKRTGVGQNGQSCTAHPVHPGDVTNCPKAGDTQTYVEVGSYLLNGTQGVTVSQLDPLDNHASATGVIQGAQVTWVATIDQNASMGPLSWYWAAGETGPDQDANPTTPLVGTVPVSCNGLTCAYTPLTSGRMYVQGKLIGLWAHKGSEAVIVTPMSLVASPTTVHANDSVTYTLTVGGGLHSWGWTWTPDPPPVVQPVPGSCVAGTNVCKSKVTVSGTEEVTVMMNGQKIKTSAHVVVSP